MSTTADLTKKGPTYDTGNDTIVIVKMLEAIPGGRTLDVSAYTPDVIPAGHIIICTNDEKTFKPMLVTNEGAYAALPANHKYAGILISTHLKSKPFAGIMVRGTVNHKASFYPLTTILTAVQSALPLIRFTQD